MASSIMPYTVVAGDTLQFISQKVYNDASRWTEIAILNGLEYPFIGDTPSPTVKVVGQTLLISIDTTGDASASDLQSDSDALIFGTDLALADTSTGVIDTSGGDFSVDITGDLQTVSGIDCLKQDIMHRLVTEVGTLLYHPDYGSDFPTAIGKKNDGTWQNKAVIQLTKSILSDPRVVDVSNVSVTQTVGIDGVLISCTIVTISGSTITFNKSI